MKSHTVKLHEFLLVTIDFVDFAFTCNLQCKMIQQKLILKEIHVKLGLKLVNILLGITVTKRRQKIPDTVSG